MTTFRQACRACGLNRAKQLFVVANNRFVRCLGCGHVYLDVVHDSHTIQQMYETYESGMEFYFKDVDSEVLRNIDAYLAQCREYCRTGNGALRLLDIGCGIGILLGRAKAQGFVCEGLEICEPLAQSAEEMLGCRIHRAFLADVNLPENSFDVITMYDLIEHLQDPIDEIRRVHRLLRPGGVLFILTPNNQALMRRIAYWAYRLTLHRVERPLRTLYYSHHLSYFSAGSLESLLNRVGFQVVHGETRNQEISRLALSGLEKVAVGAVFRLSDRFPSLGGKLLVWARKS